MNRPGVAIIGCGIIGCGRIGQKRARALGPARLVACADIIIERAHALAAQPASAGQSDGPGARGVLVTRDWRDVLADPDVNLVIVATTNNLLAEITQAAAEAGKHVLVEKPAACRARDLEPVMVSARRAGVQVRVGFNHRYHRTLRKARELHEAGALGPLMFVRARYGHGGRVGYDQDWRANPALAGGGELIDQGVHLIDLARWFLGEFTEVIGFAHTYFWSMPVDDNAFMLLKTPKRQVAFLHVSCTEWKNLFSFEIYGTKAKLSVEGLGGSYGMERLAYYRMLPEMGPPETTVWEFPMDDNSWHEEFAEFLEDIRLRRMPASSLEDAYAALRIVEEIYRQS